MSSQRRPRKTGRARSDAERRRLAQSSGRHRPAIPEPPPAKGPVAWCDGGARGNPGPAAIAYRLLDSNGSVLAEEARRIGVATANVAEYRALIAALEHAAALRLDELELRLDSRMVVLQLIGRWAVRNDELRRLHHRAIELAAGIGPVSYRWIPRGHNLAADRLVWQMLEDQDSGGAQSTKLET